MASSEEKKSPRRKRRLGKGLSALMSHPVQVTADDVGPDLIADRDSQSFPEVVAGGIGAGKEGLKTPLSGKKGLELDEIDGYVVYIALDAIEPNPNQPRVDMNAEALRSLSSSIKSAGVMQPILVRRCDVSERSGGAVKGKSAQKGGFEIVAGERRWRAARMAGLETIPAIVREIGDQESAEWAIIENIQREDLNAMEKAEGFLRLMDEYDLTQLQVAERVGMDRSSVANLLRLNQLDSVTKDDIRKGLLSQGHGKALLGIADGEGRRQMGEEAILGEWSVRELENRIRWLVEGSMPDNPSIKMGGQLKRDKPEHIRTLEYELGELLEMKAEIRLGRSRSSGKVILSFNNVSEFEQLLDRMKHLLQKPV